jgi:hypothetical protein
MVGCDASAQAWCRDNIALLKKSRFRWLYLISLSHMKILSFLVLALVAGSCIGAEPTWNPADAVKEAEQDIRTGHIKFYWAGSIASRPIGVPIEVAKKYPQANAGIGCVTNDIPLRERQEEYARRYNEKMFAYVSQKH